MWKDSVDRLAMKCRTGQQTWIHKRPSSLAMNKAVLFTWKNHTWKNVNATVKNSFVPSGIKNIDIAKNDIDKNFQK